MIRPCQVICVKILRQISDSSSRLVSESVVLAFPLEGYELTYCKLCDLTRFRRIPTLDMVQRYPSKDCRFSQFEK